MDIKKADPTQRLREAAQESEETAKPKLPPTGISAVPDSLEQVKQAAFDKAIAESYEDSLLAALEEALDRIPPRSPGSFPNPLDGLIEVLREASASEDANGNAPTTTVRSERFEKLQAVKLHLNEILQEARTNNPMRDYTGVGDDSVVELDDLMAALEEALGRIPSYGSGQGTSFDPVGAILDALQQASSSDEANETESTPITSVRQEQINGIKATLTRILTGEDKK